MTTEIRQAGKWDQMGIERFFANESFTCSSKRITRVWGDLSGNRSNPRGVLYKYDIVLLHEINKGHIEQVKDRAKDEVFYDI